MSKPSCDACSNLREYNANFIMNGVTDSVAESLKNNTGFNSCLSDLHTDCEDLNDANDCLIGHLDDDVDNYDVCSWKDFMHNFLPNLYETLKANIAAMCGLWIKADDLNNRVSVLEESICEIARQTCIYVPASVGTHYYNDRTTWKYDAETRNSPYTFTLCISKNGMCNGEAVYKVGVGIVLTETDLPFRTISGSLLQEIPSWATLSTYKKSDLVPTYMPEGLWNQLNNQYSIGFPTIHVGNAELICQILGTEGSGDTLTIQSNAYIGPTDNLTGDVTGMDFAGQVFLV